MVPRVGQHVAVALLLAAASVAAAGEVTGRFEVDERAIAPKHAVAYPVRDTRDPRKLAIEVVLSEGVVDAAAAVAALEPHTQMINQEGIGNYVLFWVRPDGDVTMNATFAKTMTQYLDGMRGLMKGLVAELATNTPERVSGRIRTREPVKTRSGEVYRVDLTFTTAVTRLPAAPALDAGGGEPGKAFAALIAAIVQKDWAAMKAVLSRSVLDRFEEDYRTPEENRDYALDILEVWLPKANAKVVAGELRGESAILEVEGERWPKKTAIYVVRMVREAGAWKFEEGAMAGLL